MKSILIVLLLVYLVLTLLAGRGERYLQPRIALLLGLATLSVVSLTERLLYS